MERNAAESYKKKSRWESNSIFWNPQKTLKQHFKVILQLYFLRNVLSWFTCGVFSGNFGLAADGAIIIHVDRNKNLASIYGIIKAKLESFGGLKGGA